MREYTNDQVLEKIICNRCGRITTVARGLLKEDYVSIDKIWGYFSNKDGEIHSLDLCEECYDALCEEFAIPPSVAENNEL